MYTRMLKIGATALVALLAIAGCAARQAAIETPLISRETIFAPPAVEAPQLSPDGSMIAAVMPLNGVNNFFVFPADNPAARRPVTHYDLRDVDPTDVSGDLTYFWSADGRYLVFLRDQDGNEAEHIMRVDVSSGEIRDLTPFDGVRATVFSRSDLVPDEILVGIDDRRPGRRDLYRLNIVTGERRLIEKNDRFIGYFADNTLEPRTAITVERAEGGIAVTHYFRTRGEDWRRVGVFPLTGSGDGGDWPKRGLGFDEENRLLREIWSAGGDTDAVVEVDYASGETRVIARDSRVDIREALVDPRTHEVQAWVRHFTRREWVVLDPSIEADMGYLKGLRAGDLYIESRSRDDRRWVVRYTLANAPEVYYLYSRDTRTAQQLFVVTPALEGLSLVDMFPIVTRSSDGFDLVSYYSLPFSSDPDQDGRPDRAVPFVVLIHGGPSDERAEYGFSPFIQMLANRGYGVLYVNFRGSAGFGRAFLRAQNGEWGRAMTRDVDEQVRHMIDAGLADAAHIGVIGGSYGGFATLSAFTRSPDLYTCAISFVGPANLETFLANRPPEWSLDAWAARVGDPRTEEGRALLRERSPITSAHRVRGPLLVIQGANDRRVLQSESDQMVEAVRAHGAPVSYVIFTDEGHNLLRAPNIRAYNALVDVFFGNCLGGRTEPFGDDLANASVVAPVGADLVPGLREALPSRAH